MAPSRLQLVAATPGGASLRAILDSRRGKGPLIVTAFGNGRLRAAKEILGEAHDVEFVEFGALVGQYLALAGGSTGGLPGSGHIASAVEIACEGLYPGSVFNEVARTPGFQKRVTQCLNRLRGFGLEGEQLGDLAEEAEPALAAKLEGLAFIQKEAAHTLDLLGKRFNSERIRGCLELPANVPYASRIVILAGTEDDPTNLSWIPWAAEAGADITVVTESHPVNGKMFEGGASIARQLGVEPSALPKANALTCQLFAESEYEGTASPIDVEVFAMPDGLGEAEWTLRAAMEEIERGIPPERIAILARRMEEYAPSLESSALRLGISLSVTRTMPLLAAGVPKFLLELLESLNEREPARFGVALRSSYFGLTAPQLRELESCLIVSRADRADPWGALERAVLEVAEALPWLGELFKWRRTAQEEPLILATWTDRLRDLGELPWLQRAFEGHEPTTVRDRYAMNVLQRCLAEMAAVERVRDNRPVGFRGFVRRCREQWEKEEVAIPRSDSGVAVVATAAEISSAEVVFVLGMLEGVFPRRRSEDPILTDADLHWLSEKIGHAIPDSHRRAREERDEFFRVCNAPTRRLVLSYPQSGEDKDNVKAFYLTEVERLMQIATPSVRSRRQLTPDAPVSLADVRLQAAIEGPREEPLKNELADEETKAFVRRKPNEAYTLRDLQRVLECPFRYMAASKLGIRSNRPQSRWNRLLGLPEQVNLPASPDPETARQRLNGALQGLLDELYGEATPEDLAVMRLGGNRLIGEWVDREFRAREVWQRAQASPDPRFDEELRSRFKTKDGESIDLKGKFTAMATHGTHRVLNLFVAHEPYQDSRAQTLFERLRDSDKFYFGMAFTAIPKPQEGVGLEIDTGKGDRRLVLYPRPMPPPNAARGLDVVTIDEQERREWIDFVESQCRIAAARLSAPAVEAQAGDHCTYCDMGELCRRSKFFSELGDPFEEGEGIE